LVLEQVDAVFCDVMFDVDVLWIDVYRELRMVEFLMVAPVQQHVTVANDADVLLLMEVVLISWLGSETWLLMVYLMTDGLPDVLAHSLTVTSS